MRPGIVYLKTKTRMPVRLLPQIHLRDRQQDAPAAWCALCRRELYRADKALCRRCEGVKKDEQKREVPLQKLHPGTKSLRLRK